ncbi:MAG: response regulator, partial [Candidatus Hydrogenedentes bacterium]|nr:response regulator [Candidatus Hydrogenedentota bacterium]
METLILNPAKRQPARGTVLVVDDGAINRELLTIMLTTNGFEVDPVDTGEGAITAAKQRTPNVVLLDINMPDVDGYETCLRLKMLPGMHNVPVIFISALSEPMDKVKAFNAGGVDYVTKPFQMQEVIARIETHLTIHHLQVELEEHNERLQDLVRDQVREIAESHMATIFAMSKLAESRDDDTGKHLERVQQYCRLLAEELSQRGPYTAQVTRTFIEDIQHASPLHDIGKVAIPDNILCKPGPLTDEEFKYMQTHTLRGWETLESVVELYPSNDVLTMGVGIARSHHERWNGTGYPDKIAGEAIPLAARIMSVADVYDALTSERCYKKAMPHEQACDIILKGRGTQFDPVIVDVF